VEQQQQLQMAKQYSEDEAENHDEYSVVQQRSTQ
jgi:hypothetical protein